MGLSNAPVPRMCMASPEDVEYVQCQEELNLDLLKEHLLVERVIGQQGRGIGSAGAGYRPPTPSPGCMCISVVVTSLL